MAAEVQRLLDESAKLIEGITAKQVNKQITSKTTPAVVRTPQQVDARRRLDQSFRSAKQGGSLRAQLEELGLENRCLQEKIIRAATRNDKLAAACSSCVAAKSKRAGDRPYGDSGVWWCAGCAGYCHGMGQRAKVEKTKPAFALWWGVARRRLQPIKYICHTQLLLPKRLSALVRVVPPLHRTSADKPATDSDPQQRHIFARLYLMRSKCWRMPSETPPACTRAMLESPGPDTHTCKPRVSDTRALLLH